MSAEEKIFSLYRSQNLENIKALFIIGNGIITHGNQPLEEALRKLEKHGFLPFNPNLLGDISTLVYISNLKNLLFDSLILFLKGNLKNLPSNGTQSGFYLTLWKLCGYSYTFNVELAASYQNYQNNLSIHDSTMRKLIDLGIYKNSSACVTINWDNVLWSQSQIKNIVHLHGKCDYPISLTLPTETIGSRALKGTLIREVEDNLDNLLQKEKEPVAHLANTIKEFFSISSESINVEMFAAENKFKKWLASAEKVVIAGVRFNDYDHELIHSVSSHSNQKPDIIIINRAENNETEKKKINKIAGIFSCPTSKITFFNNNAKKVS